MQDYVINHDKAGRISTVHHGFTLVEVLVATAVLSILLLVLGQFSSMLGNTLSSGYGRAERRQDGRALMDFIGQELRAAALPVDRIVEAGKPELQMVVNPASISDRFCHPHAVFWQAPLATDTSLGNMAILGFFVRWQPATATSPPKANLCRVFINPSLPNPSSTDSEVVANPHHRIYTHLNDWITDSILDEVAPADDENGYLGLFADHVIGFFVRCLDESGEVIRPSAGGSHGHFDSRSGYVGVTKNPEGGWMAKTFPGPAVPHSVEVSMVILDSRAAAEMTDSAAEAIREQALNFANDLDAKTSSADKMAKVLQQNVSMKRIVSGLSTQSMRIYLANAP